MNFNLYNKLLWFGVNSNKVFWFDIDNIFSIDIGKYFIRLFNNKES